MMITHLQDRYERTQAIAIAGLALIFFLAMSSVASAQEKAVYSPYVGRDYPMNVYFGDTHLHTTISFDSYGDGNTTMGPEEAYRFAKGEELKGHDGVPVRISRPLDFL
jgi:hypothetical protein